MKCLSTWLVGLFGCLLDQFYILMLLHLVSVQRDAIVII
jgi:hypothetical protein